MNAWLPYNMPVSNISFTTYAKWSTKASSTGALSWQICWLVIPSLRQLPSQRQNWAWLPLSQRPPTLSLYWCFERSLLHLQHLHLYWCHCHLCTHQNSAHDLSQLHRGWVNYCCMLLERWPDTSDSTFFMIPSSLNQNNLWSMKKMKKLSSSPTMANPQAILII